MKIRAVLFVLLACSGLASAQYRAVSRLLVDSQMVHASVSISIISASTGEIISDYNSEKSLVPASVMKLLTTAAALEMLGPDHRFRTTIGYTGKLDKDSGILDGDIIIRGGGDPALGSDNFTGNYGDFAGSWVEAAGKSGIRKISGRIIADDSYFDSDPVPPKWLWEDIGNYYGAGVYGISVFDNTFGIRLNTLSGTRPVITGITPDEPAPDLENRLISAGISDSGFVFLPPYGSYGWMSGSVPAGRSDYILKASISDPPLVLAKILSSRLKASGISVDGNPTTLRLENDTLHSAPVVIAITDSPPLSEIIRILNQKSVNLYAEHLVKELGRVYGKNGSTASGIRVIEAFLEDSVGLKPGGYMMSDGSGLSPADGLDSRDLSLLLLYMKKKGKYFREFYSSLPEPGKEGTLRNRFRDPVFGSHLRAKSGSMTRVRSYAGYLVAKSGDELVFSIIVNNYNGDAQNVVTAIEDILRETAIQN